MPRTPPSPADRELIAHAAAVGVEVSGDRLEHWRRVGLLPPNERRSLGRGRGSASRLAPGAAELVVWLAHNARRGRRPADLALIAFGQDLAVPHAAVREAFAGAASAVRLELEAMMPAGSEPEDVADAAVAAGLTATIVPARVRRIDKALANAGINWGATDVAKLDPNPQPEAATASDWAFTAVKMMLEPGSVDLASIAGLMRSLMPLGAAAPFAGLMEYRWPGSEADLSDDELLNDDGGMAILPAGTCAISLAAWLGPCRCPICAKPGRSRRTRWRGPRGCVTGSRRKSLPVSSARRRTSGSWAPSACRGCCCVRP